MLSRREVGTNCGKAYLATEAPTALAEARVYVADVDQGWPERAEASAAQGATPVDGERAADRQGPEEGLGAVLRVRQETTYPSVHMRMLLGQGKE